MYMILWWHSEGGMSDNFLSCVHNEDGSIRLFTLDEADDFANSHPCSDDMRVIPIEGV